MIIVKSRMTLINIVANGEALADVPGLAFRQLKFIDKVEYCSFA